MDHKKLMEEIDQQYIDFDLDPDTGMSNQCVRREICYMICEAFFMAHIDLPLMYQECDSCKNFKQKGNP